MLNSKELRMRAWNSLKGKYWMAFVVVLVLGFLVSIGSSMLTASQNLMNIVNSVDYSEMGADIELGAVVITVVASIFAVIGLIISILVGNAATVGLCNYFIKNTYSKPSFKDAFSGFKVKYGRNIGTILLLGIKVALWSILFIIPGIIKAYEYSMIPYILADDSEISSKDAFKKSKEMMTGNKWRYFKLELSFIGWFALCVLTCGIGTFFLIPYVDAASAEFYMELKNK